MLIFLSFFKVGLRQAQAITIFEIASSELAIFAVNSLYSRKVMESIQTIKSHREAVKNIGQITKAMEVVSATKMRRAQELALNSRPYALSALEILARLSSSGLGRSGARALTSELAVSRPVKNTLLAVISSDRGLAGSFNTQVFRSADNFIAERADGGIQIIVIGKKARSWAEKKEGVKAAGQFSGWGDYAAPEEIEPLYRLMVDGFTAGQWDEVVTISAHFRTTLKQEVLRRQILPVDSKKIIQTANEIIPERGRYAQTAGEMEKPGVNNSTAETDYILEPTPQKLIDFLIPHLVKMQIYHLVLEANASEHSARMVAMKNASDNAQELSSALQLAYNKARQANITKELIEIISTQNAL